MGYDTDHEALGLNMPDMWILFSFPLHRLVYVRPNYTQDWEIIDETSIIMLEGDKNEQVTDIPYLELMKTWTAYESSRYN